jgi:hypothetical protein
MKIKKLISSPEEHQAFAWSILCWRVTNLESVWAKEDEALVAPYVKYINNREKRVMTSVEKEAMDHFELCKKTYVNYLQEIKDSTSDYEPDQLCEFLFVQDIKYSDSCYDEDDDGNPLDENGNIIPEKNVNDVCPLPDISYPFIFVGEIGYSDVTDERVLTSDKVELKDFLMTEASIT